MTNEHCKSISLCTDIQKTCNSLPTAYIPIQQTTKYSFRYLAQHNIESFDKTIIHTLDEYIQQKLPHIRHLICNYSLHNTSDSLLECIINNSSLYMSIDGAREDTTSGGRWIIATDTGQRIVHGYNSDYGKSEDIHSYRSEVYVSLVSLLFIHTYAEFYNIPITNNITGLCDNRTYVNKLNEIITNPKYLKYLYKTTEHEAYKLLSTLISINYKLHHINSRQDNNCSYNEFPLSAELKSKQTK